MDIIVREKKNEKNLFQIRYYDSNFCETLTLKGMYFENEKTAEKYGMEKFNPNDEYNDYCFEEVVMENGIKLPDEGNVFIGDANHPGDIYVCPETLKKDLLEYMHEEGLCPYEHKSKWAPKNYSICTITKGEEENYCSLHFEWND